MHSEVFMGEIIRCLEFTLKTTMGKKTCREKDKKEQQKVNGCWSFSFLLLFFYMFLNFHNKKFKLKNSQSIKKNPPVKKKKITPKISITWVALFLTVFWLVDSSLSFGCFLSQEKLIHQTHKQKEPESLPSN